LDTTVCVFEQSIDGFQDYSETHCREHFVCTFEFFSFNIGLAIYLDCELAVSVQGCKLY